MLRMIFLFLILISWTNLKILADGFKFISERMVTDFNGVAYSGNNIICYGNYGIITYSQDFGNTWQQINIGDKHNIINIINHSGTLFGVTDFSLLKSTDDGLNWIIKDLSENPYISNLMVYNDNLVILTNNGIKNFDFDLNFQNDFLTLDTSWNYKEIADDNNYYYILTDRNFILRLDKISMIMDTIDISRSIPVSKDTNNKFPIYTSWNIIIENGTIYCVFERRLYYSQNDIGYYFFHVKSINNGNTWSPLNDPNYFDKRYKKSYNVKNDTVYFMSEFLNKSNYKVIPVLNKIVDSFNIVIISDTLVLTQRDIKFGAAVDVQSFSQFIWLNKDTLIAVGNKKLIAMSYDGGKTWELKTFFNPDNFWSLPCFTNQNSIYLTQSGTMPVTKTTDGGITWLPNWYDNRDTLIKNGFYLNYFNFSENGNGFVINYKPSSYTPANYIKSTRDFGENFLFISDSLSLIPFASGINNRNGINIKNNEVLFFYNYNDFHWDTTALRYSSSPNIRTTMIVTDELGNIQRQVNFDSIAIFDAVLTRDSTLYALGLLRKGYSMYDSTYYQFSDSRYIVLSSHDNGLTWDTLPVINPIPGFTKSSIIYQMNFTNLNSLYLYKTKMIFSKYFNNPSRLYSFDIETRQFDSLDLPFQINNYKFPINRPFFTYHDTLFIISSNHVLYYTSDLNSNQIKWDSLDIKELLYDWVPYDDSKPQQGQEGNDYIVTGWSDNQNIILQTAKAVPQGFGGGLTMGDLNFVKIKDVTLVSVGEEFDKILSHEPQNYLWAFPPYPIPATNTVRSLIYWDTIIDIENDDIAVYDIFGNKVAGRERITIDKQNAFSGILTWDSSNVPDGIYLIRIIHGTKTWTLKVIVNR